MRLKRGAVESLERRWNNGLQDGVTPCCLHCEVISLFLIITMVTIFQIVITHMVTRCLGYFTNCLIDRITVEQIDFEIMWRNAVAGNGAVLKMPPVPLKCFQDAILMQSEESSAFPLCIILIFMYACFLLSIIICSYSFT